MSKIFNPQNEYLVDKIDKKIPDSRNCLVFGIFLLTFVEEVRKCVIDVMTYLRPPVNVARCFKEVQVAL